LDPKCHADVQQTRERSAWGPYLILGSAQLAVGAAAIFARFALAAAGALAVAAGRLTIAAALLWAIALWSRGSLGERKSATRVQRRWGLPLAGIALAIHFGTWIWSLQYTSVAISTLLVATTPVWTALYDAVFARRALGIAAWGAMAAGAGGLILVVGSSRTAPPVPGHELLGAGLALCGAIAIGGYFIIVRGVRHDYGTRYIVTATYSWAAAVLLLAAIAARQPPPPAADTAAWGGIAAMALISQLWGHTAMNAALRWFSPNAVAMSTLVEPIVAALLAFAIFGEALGPSTVAGAALILTSIAVFLRVAPPA
jgi:drug/metabolite transporter (DMT)-like permease